MSLPLPETGFVIRYSYLWRDGAKRGQEEGRKDRSCAVILAIAKGKGETDAAHHPGFSETPKSFTAHRIALCFFHQNSLIRFLIT